MPVHPTLEILAAWKLEGFERFVDRKPKPADLIVPALPRRQEERQRALTQREPHAFVGSTKTSSASGSAHAPAQRTPDVHLDRAYR
jgi:hypothetical protein